jgi:hypothetical protein
MSNPEGYFQGLNFNDYEIPLLADAYHTISEVPNGWAMLARKDVPGDSGFIDPKHTDPEVIAFLLHMKSKLHVPEYGYLMRQMETIAKSGWTNFTMYRRSGVYQKKLILIDTD